MRKIIMGMAAAATLAIPSVPAVANHDGYYHGRTWQDSRGRLRCRKSNGTTGLIVGGVAGALAGRAIDTRGERTTGTLLGAAAGALAGREIERSRSTRGRRCR